MLLTDGIQYSEFIPLDIRLQASNLVKAFIDVGNAPNQGQISNLPINTIVETVVHADGNGFTPPTFGPLPSKAIGFVESYARVLLSE